MKKVLFVTLLFASMQANACFIWGGERGYCYPLPHSEPVPTPED